MGGRSLFSVTMVPEVDRGKWRVIGLRGPARHPRLRPRQGSSLSDKSAPPLVLLFRFPPLTAPPPLHHTRCITKLDTNFPYTQHTR